MSAPADPRPRDWRGWLPLILPAAIVGVALCVVVALRTHEDPERGTSDFRDFWLTARHYQRTGEISSDFGVHNYPPFFTIFMTPWGLLPLKAAAVVFTLLSLGLFGISVVMTEMLLNDGLPKRPRLATVAAILLMLPYVVSCAVLGQMGLLLVFLVVSTWLLVERGREWTAGVPLGLAAAIKLLPLVLVVYFLLRQRWRVAASATVTVLVFGLGLPLLSLGYDETVRQQREFFRGAVLGHSAKATLLAEKPRKAKYSNNALPIVLRRLLTKTDGDPHEERPALFINAVDLPRDVVWWVYLVLMTLLVLTSMAAAIRAPTRWPPETMAGATAVRAQYGAWCALMLLATPLLWTHYLVLLYWPLALVADRVERTWRADHRVWRGGAAALAIWVVGAALLAWPAARAAGAQLWSVGALWVVVMLLAVRRAR